MSDSFAEFAAQSEAEWLVHIDNQHCEFCCRKLRFGRCEFCDPDDA